MGQAIVIVAGGIDLSVVSVLILTAVIMGGAGSERQAQMMPILD
jgi:ribose/xylose/arabinose/galactoside ABC-type transport system permease subunit